MIRQSAQGVNYIYPFPIKVEIINGGMDSKLYDAKIQITNISDKRIYLIDFALSTPEDFPKVNGRRTGISTQLNLGADIFPMLVK